MTKRTRTRDGLSVVRRGGGDEIDGAPGTAVGPKQIVDTPEIHAEQYRSEIPSLARTSELGAASQGKKEYREFCGAKVKWRSEMALGPARGKCSNRNEEQDVHESTYIEHGSKRLGSMGLSP